MNHVLVLSYYLVNKICLQQMQSHIHEHTKPSITLEIMGVRLIGRRSLLTCLGGFTLGRAHTCAALQASGTYPSLIELLKIEQYTRPRTPAKSRSIQVGIPSGPADLEQLIDSSAFSICSTEIWYLSGTSMF